MSDEIVVPSDEAADLKEALSFSQKTGRHRICVCPGTYLIQRLLISHPVHIFGMADRGDVELEGMVILGVGKGEAILENLTIVNRSDCAVEVQGGCADPQTIRFCNISCPGNDAMWVYSGLTVQNTVVHDCSDAGLNLQGGRTSKFVIENCEFHHCSTGVAFSRICGEGGHLTMRHNYFHDCREFAYDLGKGEGIASQNKMLAVVGQSCADVTLEANDEAQAFPGLGTSPEKRTIVLVASSEAMGGASTAFVFTRMSGEVASRVEVQEAELENALDWHSLVADSVKSFAACIVLTTARSGILARGAISAMDLAAKVDGLPP